MKLKFAYCLYLVSVASVFAYIGAYLLIDSSTFAINSIPYYLIFGFYILAAVIYIFVSIVSDQFRWYAYNDIVQPLFSTILLFVMILLLFKTYLAIPLAIAFPASFSCLLVIHRNQKKSAK